MILLQGYKVEETLHEGKTTAVYRGLSEAEQHPVVLKASVDEYPSFKDLAKLKREYEIAKVLAVDGVVRPRALEKYNNGLVLVFEDFGGVSLNQVLKTRKVSISAFLKIALRIAEVLEKIHEKDVIHLDIKPHNIIINLKTGEVALTDFGISSQLTRENPTIVAPGRMEGTLAYMSPEQTGRMNRAIDYRSDFYSLGVTFYEMLCGKLPFDSVDPMEMVHNHIAVEPVPPRTVNDEVPAAISAIVMKLLAKNAEDRYQSAYGLRADIEECLRQMKAQNEIAEFVPGSRDATGRFQIPQRLYGRDVETQQLLDAFKAVGKGDTRLMVVKGYSGIGKSALISEVHKPLVESRGYFISGKFDQFNRDIPYSSIIQAFKELIRQLLTENQEQIVSWKEQIQKAVGPNGQVIIDVIPDVELIIGEQAAVPELGPTEAQNRFNLVFKEFVRSLASKKHPLIIFLDDMQWADSPSIKLIQNILLDTELRYLMLILSFRDNEVDEAHPVSIMLDQMQKVEINIEYISLKPLSLDHIRELVKDTLNVEDQAAMNLVSIIHSKTNGNPFFVNEFLKTLYQEKMLNFDSATGAWVWDAGRVQNMGISDNVVELMSGKIQRLSQAAQSVLKLASCIGSTFDLTTLSIVANKSPKEAADDINEVLKEGLVNPIGDTYKFFDGEDDAKDRKTSENPNVKYKFLHDRVQQAAYGLIPEDERSRIHLTIGRQILKDSTESEIEEDIFNIINHLNMSYELVEDPAEKLSIARLNLDAGKKAKLSSAYDPAARYLKVGMELLPADAWKAEYELALSLNTEYADVQSLNGNYAESEVAVKEVLGQARGKMDQVPAYLVQIRTYNAQNLQLKAIDEARRALRLLGVFVPKNASFLKVGPALARTKLMVALRGGSDYLLKAPEMKRSQTIAAVDVIINVASSAYQTNFWLFAYYVMVLTYLSYRFGNAPSTPYAIGLYGLAHAGVLKDFKNARKYADLAMLLVEKLNARLVTCKTYFMKYNFIWGKSDPTSESFEPLTEGARAGWDTGDFEYAGYSEFFRSLNGLFTVMDLPGAARDWHKTHKKLESNHNAQAQNVTKIWLQYCMCMLGKTEDPLVLTGEYYDEAKMLPFFHETGYDTAIGYHGHAKALLYYHAEEFEKALIHIEAGIAREQGLMSMEVIPPMYMLDALVRCKLYATATRSEKSRHRKKFATSLKLIRSWAKGAPMNQQHRVYLVEAERARALGNPVKAIEYYDRAIETARENGNVWDEALANELAGDFYLKDRQNEKVARTYLTDARYGYVRWGSPVKVRWLEARYPEIMRKVRATEHMSDTIGGRTTTATGGTSGGETASSLDIGTVMKASQTLSGEIFLDRLLTKVMNIVVENAGAQRGLLVLETDGELYVEAESGFREGEPVVQQSIPVAGNVAVPAAIMQYVQRTGENVVLGDAATEGRFTKSPYVIENKPKSVLCTPITKQGKLVGILYLENNLTTNAFTPDRVEILSILSAQAAISLENARLVADETERQKLQKEMEMAKSVQMSILPAETEDEDYNIAAHMTPADQVGGDYYDYYRMGVDRWIAIGDVTGHGLNSGLLMLMAQTGFSTYLNSTTTPDTLELFKAVNRTLHNNMATRTKQNLYMTFTALRADADGNFEHVGKHEDILVWRKANAKVEVVATDGVWMGIVPDVSGMVDKARFKLDPGDFIILFTDGVIECRDTSRQQFDTHRLIQVIEENAAQGIKVVKDQIVKSCFDFMDHQDDDVTLFLMEKK